jgi:hypothetical protein
MKKYGGPQYVKDFSFPSECGFSGSAGKASVKGYMRGGKVAQKGQKATMHKKRMAKGTTKAAMGGYMGPEREITVDDVKITTPAMKKGGRMKKSTHDKLMAHGKKMGYKTGGYVAAKDTSGEFRAKRGKQDTMDTGVQPARRGKNARSAQEEEAGGTGRLKPGLAKGGLAKAARAARRSPDHTKGKGMSKKGMPTNVRAKGGKVGYMRGGKMRYAKGGGSC